MSKPWRELVHISAIYYTAGEYPFASDVHPDEAERASWGDYHEVWWYPGAEEAATRSTIAEDMRPPVDEAERLTTEAVRMEFTICATGATNGPHMPGLLAHEIDGMGLNQVFGIHADTLKACLDVVRGESANRYVSALVVYECEAGKDPDTWIGPGDYWTRWEPLGVLNLSRAEVQAVRSLL